MKTIAWLALIGTLMAGLVFMIQALNQWEWNRVLFFGLVVVIAEIALATALILRRLPPRDSVAVDPELVEILRTSRPANPNRFAWMRDTMRQTNVFITFLVGGGVILSGVAWMIDRAASRTGGAAGDKRLAQRIVAISYPRGGLLVDDVTALAQEIPGADDAQIRKLLGRAGHQR